MMACLGEAALTKEQTFTSPAASPRMAIKEKTGLFFLYGLHQGVRR